MARQIYYLEREQRNPLYKTRMLQAGPHELDAGAVRLFRKLGVPFTDEKPKKAEAPKAEAPKVEAPKAPAKKKATKRKAK